MQLQTLLGRRDDERAATPVIGIVLLIAVVVILAGIVSTSATGLFGVANDVGPNMNIKFDYKDGAPTEDSWGTVDGTYDGVLEFTFADGAELPPERFTVVGASGHPDGASLAAVVTAEHYEVGTTLEIAVNKGDTVRIVWRDPGGEKTTAVAVWHDS